jgi:hypothetical protein
MDGDVGWLGSEYIQKICWGWLWVCAAQYFFLFFLKKKTVAALNQRF